MSKRKLLKNTSTSSFGSPGRDGHDSSAFYKARLYADQPQAGSETYVENAPARVDVIFSHSSEAMSELPDCSAHLMVTSPPYNVGKDYDEDLSLEEYLSFLRTVWKEVYRVLVPGGRACLNVANLGRKPYIPLNGLIAKELIELGFLMRGEIIWDKAASSARSWWGRGCISLTRRERIIIQPCRNNNIVPVATNIIAQSGAILCQTKKATDALH